jgi:hypothetical protein
MRLRRLLRPTSYLTPVSKVAIATFLWAHRHEVMRWGRSLYEHLVVRRDLGPVRAARVASLLAVIAMRDDLRNAPQLRKVSLHGDRVDLDVDERWPLLPTLIARVRGVKGIREVRVNGTTVDPADAAAPRAAIPA